MITIDIMKSMKHPIVIPKTIGLKFLLFGSIDLVISTGVRMVCMMVIHPTIPIVNVTIVVLKRITTFVFSG